MSKTKKSSRSLSSRAKKFSRAGLAVLSCIPTPGWGRASKKALAVSVSRSKVKKTSTKNKNQKNKKTSKKLSSLKNLLKRLSQKSRYGRMYTNARKLSSEWKLKDRILKLKTMMLQATVSVQKRPTNEKKTAEDVYEYFRKNKGEFSQLETRGYEIDPRTGDYHSDFYSKRKVLGNPSSNLKPYIEPEAVNFFTEDFGTLIDKDASFRDKLEAGFFIMYKPAKVVDKAKKVAKTSENISDVGKGVSKGTGNNRPSWRQSEKDVESQHPNYQPQKSFKDGEEVPYGTKGSSRPDLYKSGRSLEVKNYKVTTSEGRSRLISNVSGQVNKRLTDLPPNTKQTVIIDVRGQNVSNNILKEIRNSIGNKTNGKAEIKFIID